MGTSSRHPTEKVSKENAKIIARALLKHTIQKNDRGDLAKKIGKTFAATIVGPE
jgi:hypothetical protein